MAKYETKTEVSPLTVDDDKNEVSILVHSVRY